MARLEHISQVSTYTYDMFKKLGTYLKECVFDIKRALFDSKPHFYICLGAFAIGLLIALSKDYSDVSETNNFVFLVVSGNASPIPQFLRLILWLGVSYIIIFLTSVHFFVFVSIGYGGIVVMSFIIFSHAFCAVAVDTLSGLIYTILYIIPTILIGLIAFICALREIYKLLNYNCNKRCIVNVGCHRKTICKIITPIWVIASIAIMVYWLIFYLILIIFT